jgi:hypothetical protein
MRKKSSRKITLYRSAVNGRFATKEFAENNPRTTEKETREVRRKKKD